MEERLQACGWLAIVGTIGGTAYLLSVFAKLIGAFQ